MNHRPVIATITCGECQQRGEQLDALRARLAESEGREQALRKVLGVYQNRSNWRLVPSAVAPPGTIYLRAWCGPMLDPWVAAAQPATDPRRGVGEADLLFQQPSGAEPARPDAGGEG